MAVILRARRAFSYAGARFVPGDEFATGPVQALILLHRRQVEVLDLDGTLPVPDLIPAPPVAPVREAPAPAPPAADEADKPDDGSPPRRRRRTYRRRDLVPEALGDES